MIISNDINNQYAPTVAVIPITSKTEKIYPFEVYIQASKKTGVSGDSKAKCEQIRTIDKRRLIKLLGKVSEKELKEIEKALLIHLGINL